MREEYALALVFLAVLAGVFVLWYYYVRPKPAAIVPSTKIVGLPQFDNAQISLTVNASKLIYNVSSGKLSESILITVANKGSGEARNIIVGVVLPGILKYYMNGDESGWTLMNFTGILGSKGLYVYKDVLDSGKEAKVEYTLALYPQVPVGNYTVDIVAVTLNGATEDSFIKIVPITVEVVK